MLRKLLTGVALAALGAITAVGVSSCAVGPKVSYQLASTTAAPEQRTVPDKMIDAFDLQKSRLDIDFKNTAEAGKTPKYQLTVVSTPVEDAAHRIFVLKEGDLLSRTTLSIAKRQNTELIDNAGIEVTDNRNSLITNAGSVLKLLGPLVFTGAKDGAPALTPEADFSTHWALDAPDVWTGPQGTAEGQKYTHQKYSSLSLTVGAPPVTALPFEQGRARFFNKTLGGIYYAACRPVHVVYTLPGGAGALEWRGKIADPGYLEYVAFPNKGKVQFHTECGVTVTTEKDPASTSDALVATAVAQAMAVKDAIDKANKDDPKK